jgi:hypothetical protein
MKLEDEVYNWLVDYCFIENQGFLDDDGKT